MCAGDEERGGEERGEGRRGYERCVEILLRVRGKNGGASVHPSVCACE